MTLGCWQQVTALEPSSHLEKRIGFDLVCHLRVPRNFPTANILILFISLSLSPFQCYMTSLNNTSPQNSTAKFHWLILSEYRAQKKKQTCRTNINFPYSSIISIKYAYGFFNHLSRSERVLPCLIHSELRRYIQFSLTNFI